MKTPYPHFRGSVLAELVSRTLFVGIVVLFVYGGVGYYVSKKTFDSEMGNRLLAIANLSAGQVRSDWLPYLNGKGDVYKQFRESLAEKKTESQAQNIFILDKNGRVIVDANGQYDFLETNWLSSLDPEPLERAQEGKPSVSILFSEKDGGVYKIGYSPIRIDGKIIGVLGVEASATYMDGLNQFAKFLFSFGLVCLFLMGGLLFAFGQRFISPIDAMAKASEKIAEGDFSQRVKVTSENELGALAHAFNEMTKRLQSHNEYILESMSNGILVLDLGGHITTFNRAASQILDLPQDQAVGHPYAAVFSRYPAFLNAVRSAHENHRKLDDLKINLSEEDPKFLLLKSAPLLGADSQELGTEILFNDETQLRKLESQVKNTEKLATIGELAASIAHEIRNPLGAMKGFTEILQRKLKDLPDAKEMVADIGSEIEILNKIVTNFLVFAKPTNLDVQEADLNEAIRGLLPLVEKEAENKKIDLGFKSEAPIPLELDVEQFRRALLNVTLNAIQAAPPGSKVALSAKSFSRPELLLFLAELGFKELLPAEAEGQWAAVWIKDQGPGIDPAHFKKLFTPFFTTKTEGFGLGLSITKKILESMGGNVAAVNRPEGGAVFMFILPVVGNLKEARS